MQRYWPVTLVFSLFLALALPPRAQAQGGTEQFLEYLQGHLEIGTRITTFNLSDDTRSTSDPFLGNINELNDKQNQAPTKFFVDWMFNPYVGVELTWDEVEASTKNFNNGLSDGSMTLSGPILSVMGRYPIQEKYIPYLGLGMAFYSADFSEDTWWALGFSSPQQYAGAGSPSTSLGGKRRSIDVDDETAVTIYFGFLWKPLEHWGFDVYLRQMNLSPDAAFIRTQNGAEVERQNGSFTLDHWVYGIGARYIF